MNLFHQSQPSIDPREFLRDHGLTAFADTLRVGGRYVCQERPLLALAKSLRRRKPLYVAGKRGTGKTALAIALAKSFNLRFKRLQCMDDLSTGDMLYEFDAAAQNQFVEQRLAAGASLERARAEQWGREFLTLGTVLEVYEYARTAEAPPLLILDEVDKLSAKSRQKLLEVLDESKATVPRLAPDDRVGIDGDCPHPPIVIMTSNNMDDTEDSAPFRSRSYFVSVKQPTVQERILILATSVPEAPLGLLRQVVRVMEYISHQGGIIDKPEIREAKDWLFTLVDEGVESLDRATIDENICCLAKSPGDEENMIGMVKAMELAAHKPDARIDGLVEEAYAATRGLVAAA